MNTNQIEALIGMLTVLGILALMITPSLIGIRHDRRIDRQLKEAEQRQDGHRYARAA
jgi:type II secretory pathway pseudopilin PulG